VLVEVAIGVRPDDLACIVDAARLGVGDLLAGQWIVEGGVTTVAE
jgi:hypothetical protein